jgi:Vam6/Vps39-like protein vacuolar protein sorting-associated protein 39
MGKVLDFLVSIKRELGTRYLEHRVNDLQEMGPEFHDRLATLYLEAASDESIHDEQRQEIRDKLVKFLEKSNQYVPERVLARLRHSSVLFGIRFNVR